MIFMLARVKYIALKFLLYVIKVTVCVALDTDMTLNR